MADAATLGLIQRMKSGGAGKPRIKHHWADPICLAIGIDFSNRRLRI
jgi:hypothetical protein